MTGGLLGGLRHGLMMKLPQGEVNLACPLPSCCCWPVPIGSRRCAINFFYLAALQCILAYTLVWLTNDDQFLFWGWGCSWRRAVVFALAGGNSK